ncbi:Uncharacterised protein [Mycobacteroides abscessus subsp. abscessus]|nr:Uncharacterised protein [Mycobacteroides abscessus subsp. abscessus]
MSTPKPRETCCWSSGTAKAIAVMTAARDLTSTAAG